VKFGIIYQKRDLILRYFCAFTGEMMKEYLLIFIIVMLVLGVLKLLSAVLKKGSRGLFRSHEVYEIEAAGKRGEKYAFAYVKKVLKDGDVMLNNVALSYEKKKTELDALVINKNGVYIIEVKNFKGRIYGKENDEKWKKVKVTGAGNVYNKYIDNPLGQLNREVYILAKYLKKRGINVWINGYVFFVNKNSPIHTPVVLENLKDVDAAIHTKGERKLSDSEISRIIKILK